VLLLQLLQLLMITMMMMMTMRNEVTNSNTIIKRRTISIRMSHTHSVYWEEAAYRPVTGVLITFSVSPHGLVSNRVILIILNKGEISRVLWVRMQSRVLKC